MKHIQNETSAEVVESHLKNWNSAAGTLNITGFNSNFMNSICDSGLPGTSAIRENGTWSQADRIQYLKLLCGQREDNA